MQNPPDFLGAVGEDYDAYELPSRYQLLRFVAWLCILLPCAVGFEFSVIPNQMIDYFKISYGLLNLAIQI